MTSKPILFTIDGVAMQAAEGETILDVATKHGIFIPTLCSARGISKTTACFVCVVRHIQSDRYVPACAACPAANQDYESNSKEVFAMRQSALNLLLSEHTGDCEAPCTISCPAHARVEEYVREGRRGNFLETLKILKQRIPLPISISRVCPRFCEKDCRRNITDAPVAINEFKRLAAELHYDAYVEECKPLTDRKVAIIGGGPAGFAVAYYLRLEGVASHIFEMMPQPGGMLRYGIPEYRLPKKELDRELAHFEKLGGITIHCNQTAGTDFQISDLQEEFDAVAVTIGCWKSVPLRCEGEELAVNGIDWLRSIASQQWTGGNPGATIVIGGGNTAMDCVRTAIRLGSQNVRCLYRRSEMEMPAEKLEVEEAKEEGVQFDFLVAPIKLERRDGKVLVTCVEMTLGAPDASGRRRPVPRPDSTITMVADTVIAAIGQTTALLSGMTFNRFGNIDVTAQTLHMTDNVYSAGDCVTGAATVVEAVAAGRKAALSILDRLHKREHREPELINVSRGHWRSMAPGDIVHLKEPADHTRVQLDFLPLHERQTTFGEVNATPSISEMKLEGTRCFECSCTAKGSCALKSHSEQFGATPDAIPGKKIVTAVDTRHPSIIHDRNKCIKCGICIKICAEVINQTLLGYKNRGFATEVGPAYQHALPDSCTDCMACVEACPVGALDKRFKP